jgi:hypothetical protein
MIGVAVRRNGSSTLMAWVACLLTFGASGDDINLARLLLCLQASSAASDALPLDDPNTDFTLPAKITIAQFPSPVFQSDRADLAAAVGLADHRTFLPDLSANAGSYRLPELVPPLRC